MRRRGLVLLLLWLPEILSTLTAVKNDGIFTSNANLQSLISTKAELVKALETYITEEEAKLRKLRTYLEDNYTPTEAEQTTAPEEFVSNPLNSFVLIKKLTSDFQAVYESIVPSGGGTADHNHPAAAFAANISAFKAALTWPSDEDLNGAASALVRLQDVYQLKTEDLSNGILNGVDYGPSLSAHDCFELGRQTYNNGDHYHTEIWMAQALVKWEKEERKTVDRADIFEYLAFSAYVQGNIRKALKYTDLLLQENPDHPRAYGNKVYYENFITEAEAGRKRKGDDGLGEAEENLMINEGPRREDDTPEKSLYEKLCRGEEVLEKSISKDFKCYYYFGHHPYMRIAPVKAEQLSLDPELVMYYDVISDSEIETIKYLATPRFERATVQNYKTGELETANYRISKTAWLKRHEHEDVANVYQRVGDITGLNMDTSEELQVSNYGIGGHYDPHFDFARREEANAFKSLGTGNRIATWLFYETEVEQGGATVFPTLGLTLWPKKGAAAFWYNLYRNGEGNERTRHAACPVLKGTKWVSNFWIHERGQEFTHPCSLSPYE